MLRSIKLLYGNTLKATDGEIGHIKDFYFDDQNWAVRYLVADTGSWLSERLVLISPHVFTNFDLDGACRGVNLTRKQIENSPTIESHKPVSRQFEEAYFSYYGWPNYWQGGDLWGMGAYPVGGVGGYPMGGMGAYPMGGMGAYPIGATGAYPMVEPPVDERQNAPDINPIPSSERFDPHLRSTQALNGYHIQTDEGAIGHVTDFIVDYETWAICHLVVETGHWYSGKEIVISPKEIKRISYDESKVFVSVTKESILKAPEYHVPPQAFNDSSASTRQL